MANIEAQFISRLVSGNKQDHSDAQKYRLDVEDFRIYDREYEYLKSFEERYNKFPDKQTFGQKFRQFKFVNVPEPLSHYADSLLERRNKATLIAEVHKVEPLLNSKSPGDVNKAIAHLADTITSLVGDHSVNTLDWKTEARSRFKEYLRRNELRKKGQIFTSPYTKLNAMVPTGFVAQNLITLMSRPSVGKTWILAMFALHWMSQGARVLFISKEMSEKEIQDRLDAVAAKLNWVRFQLGRLNLKQRRRYREFLRNMRKTAGAGNIIVVGEAKVEDQGIDSLMSQIETYKPDVVIVDGLAQYDGKGRDEVQKMLYISRRMKRVAKAKKLILMQSIHTHRAAEGKKRGGGLGAASWSDAIIGDSDFVFELVAHEGREKSERLFRNLKGRNAAFGEFYIKMKMKPFVDLSELTTLKPMQRKVKLSKIVK